MKLLLFLFLFPAIIKSQVLRPIKVIENPLMPIVCGTPILINGKPDSFLLKIVTDRDKRRYKNKVQYIWLDLNRKPFFYDKRGKILKLKLKN